MLNDDSNGPACTLFSGAFDLISDRLTALDKMPQITGVVFWEWHIKKDFRIFSKEFNRILRADVPLKQRAEPYWWRSLIHDDDMDDIERAERDLLENRSASLDIVFRIKTMDSCWVWCSAKGQVAERENGEPSVVVGVLTHISRLRVHGKFQHVGAGIGDPNYHAVLENSPDLYVRMDHELFPLYTNPVVARYTGIERGKYTFDQSPDDMKLDREQLAFLYHNVCRVFDEGATIREMISFKIHDGTTVTGEYSFWPEYDETGRVASAMTHFRDLTEQTHMEYAARLDERWVAAMYELSQMEVEPEDEILGFVIDTLIDLTNSEWGFVVLPGNDEGEKGKIFWSYDQCRYMDDQYQTDNGLPPDLMALAGNVNGDAVFPNVRNGNGTDPVHVWSNGEVPILRSIVAAATEQGKQVLIAGVCNKKSDYLSDVRQLQTFINGTWVRLRRRRLVDELCRAKEAAEAANEAKNLFLANISHELRTPLNGLLGILQLFDTRLLSPEQSEYIKTAIFSGNTLVRIISDILDLSRIESRQMELVADVFDLKDSLRASLRIFEDEAEARGLLFEVDIDENIPDALLGDDARVRQIVFNLVGNALKFTDSGKITVRCRLQSRDASGKVELRITVSDTGIGIPPEQQNMIFEAFTQVNIAKKRPSPGTGLGLSIVKRLAAMMNGSIEMDSAPGMGTTMHCNIVLNAVDEGEKGSADHAPDYADRTLPMDILVAEDDDASAFVMKVFLQRLGHRVVCVENGKKALEALQLHSFDCLFTDIQMPEMNGLELVECIRQGRLQEAPPSEPIRQLLRDFLHREMAGTVALNPDLPIVAVSAHAMNGDRERFLRHGINEYMSKPVAMARLDEVLKRLRG